MQKYIAWVLESFFLLTGISGQVSAQFPRAPVHSEWELAFFGGLSSAGDETSFTLVSGQDTARLVGLEYESGYLVGLRITQNLGEQLGAELEYSFANQPARFVNLRPTLARLNFDHNIHSIIYSFVYYPFDRFNRLRPFASIGGGTSLFHISGNSKASAASLGAPLQDTWKFAFSFGGGVKYALTDRLAVRFDVRDQITGVPAYGLPETASVLTDGDLSAAFRPEGRLNNWLVHVGVCYFLGK